jgi:tetratricopeptide (TPR) repeat protein
VSQEGIHEEVERLVALGAADPAAPGFAALAEAQRRAGSAEEALRVAEAGLRERPEHAAGRVALALALLDLGRIDEAREQLLRVLDAVPDHPLALRKLDERGAGAEAEAASPFSTLDEAELEDAFEEAEAEPEEMVDANRLAEAALHAIEEGAPEGLPAASPDSPFVTETVAELLERQGHRREARAVREAIGRRGGDPRRAADRGQVLATLERWLDNLRRGSR